MNSRDNAIFPGMNILLLGLSEISQARSRANDKARLGAKKHFGTREWFNF